MCITFDNYAKCNNYVTFLLLLAEFANFLLKAVSKCVRLLNRRTISYI